MSQALNGTLPFNNPVIQRLNQSPDERQANWCMHQEEARLLHLLAKIHHSKAILEIGTSIGYSTLHLGFATAAYNGKIITLDASSERQNIAKKNIQDAGLSDSVEFVLGDALTSIKAFQKQEMRFDFMLLDARKSEYIDYWQAAETLLITGGLLVADNTESHKDAMLDFISAISTSSDWLTSQLETPNGLIIAQKIGL